MRYGIMAGFYGAAIGLTLSIAVVLGYLVNANLALSWSSLFMVDKGLLALAIIFPLVTGILTGWLQYYQRLHLKAIKKINKLEKDMLSNQRILSAVTSMSPIIILAVDPSFRIQSANAGIFDLIGTTSEEARGRFCYEVFGYGMICRDCPVTKAYVSGKPARRSSEYCRYDGQILLFEQLAVPVIENGAVQYVIEVMMDFSERTEMIRRREEDLIAMIDTLVSLIELKDKYTGGHSQRVRKWAIAIAKQLELTDKEISDIDIAACLHDIGKIGLPESILNKAGELTQDEYKTVTKHAVIGESAIGSIERFQQAAKYVRHHHERYDGLGYPDGLQGKEIPMGSRIISVADAYDAMISNRAYRHGFTMEKAVQELKRNAAKQFDPTVVDTFIKLLDKDRYKKESWLS